MLTREKKIDIVNKSRIHENDTGSPEVQITLLSERIKDLTEHFKVHKDDHHSRRGLLKLVTRRRSLLSYLKRVELNRYKTVIDKLGLKK
jgi:small subunit ribosomal protein S15